MAEPLKISKPALCGMGEGEHCCAFLSMMTDGFTCGRTLDGIASHIRARLDAGTMNAKYDPGTTPYPECQAKRVSQVSEK